MLIRKAQIADIPLMTEIRLAVRENVLNNPALVTYDDYVDYLTRRGQGWVAEENGRMAGFAIADLQDHSIWALFVHPEYDCRGIGRALHDAMLAWYFAQTTEPVWLSTAPGTRAEGFYRHAGWQETGRTKSGEVRFEMSLTGWMPTNRPDYFSGADVEE
ncbi:GNAT family N-acetyltransferase [Hymenobacter negativus]|uniref:GNAT family N-acetyltransferase n=1 Tax=Hymenobacter negativus TaxID=2795026 RepID=A0ABS3QET6_9BACT|nr:GNAT family N-acetyltransferase [Hymenobacter negativus]MBO2009488.1 GNAT family N-acetyltransferase [Hymenobacter negativus]